MVSSPSANYDRKGTHMPHALDGIVRLRQAMSSCLGGNEAPLSGIVALIIPV